MTDKVVYEIQGKIGDIDKKLDVVNKKLKQSDDSAKKLSDKKGKSGSLAGLKMGYMAAAAGIAVLVRSASQWVKMARVQQEAENRLETAYKNLGDETGILLERSKAFASELQSITTIGDETTLEVMQLGLSMGVSAGQIEEATRGAIGLSKSLKIDLTAAMKMTTLALNGDYNMLQRYIPALKTATSEAEKAAIVQKAMAEGFNIATGEVDTQSGKMTQLANSWGDFQEQMGAAIMDLGETVLPYLQDILKFVSGIFKDVVDGIDIVINQGKRVKREFDDQFAQADIDSIVKAQKEVMDKYKISHERLNELGEMSFAEFSRQAKNRGQVTTDQLRESWDEIRHVRDELMVRSYGEDARKAIEINKTLEARSRIVGEMGKKTQKTAKLQMRAISAKPIEATNEEMEKYLALWESYFALTGKKSPLDEMLDSLEIMTIDNAERFDTAMQAMIDDLNKFDQIAEVVGQGIGVAFEGIGQAVGGAEEGLKNSLKSVLNLMLDYIEKEFVIAGAAVAIKALMSGGFSLFADSAGYVAALAGIQMARGAVGSFYKGTPFVPNDQFAFIHKGERIMGRDDNERYTRGEGLAPSGGHSVGMRRDQMDANINVSLDWFADSSRASEVQAMRRVM